MMYFIIAINIIRDFDGRECNMFLLYGSISSITDHLSLSVSLSLSPSPFPLSTAPDSAELMALTSFEGS